jgi:hypothetical protein
VRNRALVQEEIGPHLQALEAEASVLVQVATNQPSDAQERFVDERFVATLFGISTGYLANLRYKGGGPKYYNLGRAGRGRCIRYRLSEVLAWAESRAATSTSSYGA